MSKLVAARLITLLTGESERVVQNQMDDTQAQKLLENVDAFMSSRQIFAPPDVIEVAALMEPAEIFTGEAGTEKLALWGVDHIDDIEGMDGGQDALFDWVEANIDAIETDPACAALLAVWGAENFEAVVAAEGGATALESHIITNITTLSADTEISAALVGAGWTAPGQ